MPQDEIIQVHIGKSGVRLGETCWELFCLEHAVQADGYLYGPFSKTGQQNGIQSNAFFKVLPFEKCEPRCVMIDLDPSFIDRIRVGPLRDVFHSDFLLTGKTDCANNFARGMYQIGTEMIDLACARIRRQMEACESPQGMILYRSYGGGTGSGFTSLLLQRLREEYNKINIFDVGIYPAAKLSPIIVEPYNTVFAAHQALEYADVSFLFDNESVYDILEKVLSVDKPGCYIKINRIIAQVISALTAALRYDDGTTINLERLREDVVPYERLHFPLISYTPFIPAPKTCNALASIDKMTNACFKSANQMIKCNPKTGKYICCNMLYRGDVSTIDINNAIFKVKTTKKQTFVDWCPVEFKVEINFNPPTCFAGGDLANVQRTVAMASNSTAIKDIWQNVARQFKSMYEKRAFIHHYLSQGMEESEFDDALYDIYTLIQEYYEVERKR